MIIGNFEFEDAWAKGVDCTYKTVKHCIRRPSSIIIYRIPAEPNDQYSLLIQDNDLYNLFKSIIIDGLYKTDEYYFNSAEEAIDLFEIFLNKYRKLKAFL